MLAFGLGTAPLLFAFGVASGLLPRRVRQRMVAVLALLVVAFGMVYLSRGLTRLGLPITPATARQALFGGPAAEPATAPSYDTAADGVKEVRLTIADVRFAPSTLSVPVDEPFRLVVDRREANACSDQLAVPELGLLADLAPNARTVIDMPAASAGDYTLTCGMGMMSGEIVAGATAAQEPSPLAWAGLGLAGAVAWYAVARPRPGSPPARRTLWGLPRSTALFLLGALVFALLAGLSLGGAFSA